MEIKKGNIVLKYDECLYNESKQKNSTLHEVIRSFVVCVISILIIITEIFLFNKLPDTYITLMYITIFLTICLIVGIYTRICIFLNKKNPNYYIIHNLIKMEKCKAVKFYNKIIILYETKNELRSMSLNYIIDNMMAKNTIIKDIFEDNIDTLYIDTLENLIIIKGDADENKK